MVLPPDLALLVSGHRFIIIGLKKEWRAKRRATPKIDFWALKRLELHRSCTELKLLALSFLRFLFSFHRDCLTPNGDRRFQHRDYWIKPIVERVRSNDKLLQHLLVFPCTNASSNTRHTCRRRGWQWRFGEPNSKPLRQLDVSCIDGRHVGLLHHDGSAKK